MWLATSLNENKANEFIASPPTASPARMPTIFTVRFEPIAGMPEGHPRCYHVNYIPSAESLVPGEDEFLFAPYSVFTVRSVAWHPAPVVNTYVCEPHVIEVDVAPDNRRQPLDLPLAPWC